MSATRKTIFNEINITPLTDIFLVLLIIMMVVAPMLDYPGLKLSVPTVGPDAMVKTDPKTVTVQVTRDDRFLIEGRQVSEADLVGTLRRLSKDRPEGVVIQTHPQAAHHAMVSVMDAAQRAGVTKIGAVEQEGG